MRPTRGFLLGLLGLSSVVFARFEHPATAPTPETAPRPLTSGTGHELPAVPRSQTLRRKDRSEVRLDLGAEGRLFLTERQVAPEHDDRWSPASEIHGGRGVHFQAALDRSDELDLFTLTERGDVFHSHCGGRECAEARRSPWTRWERFTEPGIGPRLSNLYVTKRDDGRLVLIGRGQEGSVLWIRQQRTGGSAGYQGFAWDDWVSKKLPPDDVLLEVLPPLPVAQFRRTSPEEK